MKAYLLVFLSLIILTFSTGCDLKLTKKIDDAKNSVKNKINEGVENTKNNIKDGIKNQLHESVDEMFENSDTSESSSSQTSS